MFVPVLTSEENETPSVIIPVTYASSFIGSASSLGRSRLTRGGAKGSRRQSVSIVQFTGNPTSVAPGATATFTLARTGDTSAAASVSVAITGGTSVSGDYGSLSATTISWTAGDSANKTFTLTATDDADQNDETVIVTVTPISGTSIGGTSTATLTIFGKPAISWASTTLSVTAGNTATATLTKTGSTSRTASVAIAAVAGTATSGDYGTPSPTTVTWAVGDSASKDVTITTVADADASSESFVLRASSPSNSQITGSADATITITPAYHSDVQTYISNLTADGVSRSNAELDAINTFVTGAVTDGYWANIVDMALFQTTGSNALVIARNKLKAYSGSGDITFTNATNASFSKTAGFTSAGGAGSAYFQTGVPQDLGVAGTSASRNRSMAVWPTSAASADFAAWLSAGNGGNPWTARVASPAASVLNHEFNSGSVSATGQTYTNKLITFVIESGGTARTYNGATSVGTNPTVTAIAPGAAQIGGHAYFTASNVITGNPYALSSALYLVANTGLTSTQVSNLNSRLTTLVAALAA